MSIDKKVEIVKVALSEFGEETLKKIVTRKKEEHTIFYRKTDLIKWLSKDKNYENFTAEELNILGFDSENSKTKITTEQELNKELTRKNIDEKLQEITNEETAEEVEKSLDVNSESSKAEITAEQELNKEVTKKKLDEKLQEITSKKTAEDVKEPLEVALKLQKNTDVIIGDLLSQDDIKEKFVYLLSNIDEFLGIKKQIDKNLVIPIDLLESESIGVTVRVWKSTLDDFKQFCKEHKNYTKIQLMSYALIEFMEKYK